MRNTIFPKKWITSDATAKMVIDGVEPSRLLSKRRWLENICPNLPSSSQNISGKLGESMRRKLGYT